MLNNTKLITCGSRVIPGCIIQGVSSSDHHDVSSVEDQQILRYMKMLKEKNYILSLKYFIVDIQEKYAISK